MFLFFGYFITMFQLKSKEFYRNRPPKTGLVGRRKRSDLKEGNSYQTRSGELNVCSGRAVILSGCQGSFCVNSPMPWRLLEEMW